jgi:PAS domain S-box-containing protein
MQVIAGSSMPNDAASLSGPDDRFREFMLALPLAVYTTDAHGLITFFNPAAADLVGRSPEIGSDFWCVTWRLRWPDGRPMAHADSPLATALKENRPLRGIEAVGERPDGTRFSFLCYPTPIRDGSGIVTGGVNMLLDVTDRKTADSLRKDIVYDLDRKGAAILQMTDTVLKEAQRQAHGTEARKLIQQAIQRVATISATQGLLQDPDGLTRINSWDLLSATCITVPLPTQDRVELLCECAAGDLASETAMPLGLIAKELISNAAKHALDGRAKVLVRVGLRREFGGYIFTVEDDGPGFALHPAHAHSFGLGLVMALARQLNGTFEVERGQGARCVVRFPDPRTLN